jgi:salicylate hydroxylase
MLHIVVTGAGIAGLAVAVSLRRAGHIVHIYERSSMNEEVGAASTLPPNAWRFLMAWGIDPVQWKFVKARRFTFKDPYSMETQCHTLDENTATSLGGVEYYHAHRPEFHKCIN